MEIRTLKYFLAVAREGSISKAAESVHTTQPNLSRQIRELEDELDKKLFIRGARQTVLTSEGQLFYKRAEEIVELYEKTIAEMKNFNGLNGNIYLGCGETKGMNSVIDIIKEITEAYPGIKFHLFSGNDEDVSARLDSGLVDFGLFVGKTNLKKYDYIKLPDHDIWGLLMRSDCPLAQKDCVTIEDIKTVPLLCSRQTLHSNELVGLGYDFSKLNIVSTHNLINNAVLMVKAGLGCALSIENLVNTCGTDLVFKRLKPLMKADLFLAWKKHRVFSKESELFLERLQSKYHPTR